VKILLLGKNGMLGSQFDSRLSDLPEVELLATDSDDLDILSFSALKKTFEFFLPEIVINCAGYTAVDEAEFKKKDAMKLNAGAVKSIARLCNEHGSRLIHFSTDYVFDGRKEPPDGYLESDMPNPLSTYGETKFKGEEFILKEMTRGYIVRTSWLYGPDGRNFVDTMLGLDRDELNVVNNQFGSPTYTADLADAVINRFVVEEVDGGPETPDYGIYHLTNDDFCTWYEFAVKIFELKEKRVKVHPIPSKEYRTAALRPMNSILKNTKLPKLRNWQDALEDYLG
jgi:dTDP-4-dehydrorhamnose reductase